MKLSLSIVIVHWNDHDNLSQLLSSLNNIDLRLIVVDNHSEQSIAALKAKYPQHTWIENESNEGYARACNQGLLHVTSRWVMFLNPDVSIDKQDLENLIAHAEAHGLSALSPHSSSTGYRQPLPSTLSLLQEFTPLKHLLPKSILKRNTLTGGALLIKAKIIKDIGGWDERFFLWFEDSDLTKRLHDKGVPLGWYPNTIEHHGGSSFKKLSKQLKRDLFFHAMRVYAHKHFTKLGRSVINLVTKRYSNTKLLPALSKGTSITIPNLKIKILDTFLQENYQHLNNIDQVSIVTSAIQPQDIWTWREKYPHIRFIPIHYNQGFAHTVNIGFRASTGSWVGTCNDDVALTDSWHTKLIRSASPKIGALNPIIRNNDLVESAGIQVLPQGKATPHTLPKHVKPHIADAANAACVLYRKQALEEVGIFDERFGSYLEDIDLSLRLKCKGWQNMIVPSIEINHAKHSTGLQSRKKAWYDLKNWLLVICKNWSWSTKLKYAPHILIERARNLSGFLKSL